MKANDISKVLALTNQYTEWFNLGQVFQSEEKFSHWFLSLLKDEVITHVVEESNSGNITDMFSFRISMVSLTSGFKMTVASVIALVITKSPAQILIIDMLICTSQQNSIIDLA